MVRAKADIPSASFRRLARILDALERHQGRARAVKRTPYQLLLLANAGYPPSDAACLAGYEALASTVGTAPEAILRAPKRRIIEALRVGGIVPELRADRLRAIAERKRAGGGEDPDAVGGMSPAAARKLLRSFPTIGEPGADRILLLSRTEPVAAVPSNAIQVPLRLGFGTEARSYSASYRSARAALDALLPPTFAARTRAYLLLRRHGETVCKRKVPRCGECVVAAECPFAKSGGPR